MGNACRLIKAYTATAGSDFIVNNWVIRRQTDKYNRSLIVIQMLVPQKNSPNNTDSFIIKVFSFAL